MKATTNYVSAKALEHEWCALGFENGAPSHVPDELVQADIRIYHRLQCGACGHRGHKVTPYHRGSEYRLLCACRKCSSGLEA